MIYEYEGHTYTPQAMALRLRAEYRDLGINMWKHADLDEMIRLADDYGIPEIKPLRRGRHRAERHNTIMIVPHEKQLLTLWQLKLNLDHAVMIDNVLFVFYQMGGRLVRYSIVPDGSYTTRVYDMAHGERVRGKKGVGNA